MALKDLVTLPLRLGVAATQVTLTLGELVAAEGPVRRDGGFAERLMAVIGEGGYVERVAGTLHDLEERLALLTTLADDGTLERLTADGGTLDQLVALGETLEAIAPRLAELGLVIPELHVSVNALSETVGPLSELAGRLPGSRRKTSASSSRSDDALF